MKDQQIIEVRSNCDFSLNYDTGKLNPNGEIIILTASPKYDVNKKGDQIIKSSEISEFRFKGSLGTVNKLIGQLQALAAMLGRFEQMSEAFNVIIKSNQPKEEEKKE